MITGHFEDECFRQSIALVLSSVLCSLYTCTQ